MTIYHLTTPTIWHQSHGKDAYTTDSLETEGFIHASTAAQLTATANRYFAGQPELCVLHIDTDKLESELKWELAASIGEEFPHIYGAINKSAITFMGVIPPQVGGAWLIRV
ncbi:MAG: DUF952 domain-containing protein [Flavobacteriaceae bacterium]|nr:DUF952 domain-containing protein [Flavobacteriaceae bacterium]